MPARQPEKTVAAHFKKLEASKYERVQAVIQVIESGKLQSLSEAEGLEEAPRRVTTGNHHQRAEEAESDFNS